MRAQNLVKVGIRKYVVLLRGIIETRSFVSAKSNANVSEQTQLAEEKVAQSVGAATVLLPPFIVIT